MSFERALNLAGTVCREHDYDKEPPAGKKTSNTESHKPVQHHNTQPGRGRGGGGGGEQRGAPRGRGGNGGRGGRGGGAGGSGPYNGVIPPSGEGLCRYYNEGGCRQQANSSCTRGPVTFKHACDFNKSAGQYCQGAHTRKEHDPSKH